MVHYVGILDRSGSAWGVRIPDLPGCHGGGDSVDAAIADAASAVREWAERRVGRGRALPEARRLDEMLSAEAPDPMAGETAVMIPLLLDSGRSVRANLSMDAALLNDIDAAAKARGLTRSAFIAAAAREKIMMQG